MAFFLFDMDDTLRDTGSSYLRTVRGMLAQEGLQAPANDELHDLLVGKVIPLAVRDVYAHFGRTLDAAESTRREEFITQGLITDMGRDQVMDGAINALTSLRRLGRVGIVSNGNRDLVEAASARLGFNDAVSDLVKITPGYITGRGKPSPDMLLVAAAYLGEDPQNGVMIGDTIYDMQAATQAGLVAIGFNRDASKRAELRFAGANACIESLEDVYTVSTCLMRGSRRPQSEPRP